MTDLYANALEQDADDDADVVDSWMLYLRAPALTLDASEVLQSLVQTTRFRGCTIASQSPTCSRQQKYRQTKLHLDAVRPRVHFDGTCFVLLSVCFLENSLNVLRVTP